MKPLRFNLSDALTAREEWGANCGPGALAAITGMTLDQVHPHLPDFDRKHYTNPTMMWAALDGLGVKWRKILRPQFWPDNGLVRIQWGGPWTKPGVPPRAAYGHTHWIAARTHSKPFAIEVFDINAMIAGGWIPLSEWGGTLVPWLLKECEPKSDGSWWMTHVAEIRHV